MSSHTEDDAHAYDVVFVTDCRLPGGTAASVAEEITAQHRAGYRTAIAHVDSHLVGHPRPFNPRVARLVEDGAADVLVGTTPVTAGLVLVRHPGMLVAPGLSLPPITTERCLVVVNQTPADPDGERVYYDVDTVAHVALERFGVRPDWTPIGPLVRDQVRTQAPHLELMDQDWFNVIDVDAWAAPRTRFRGDRPVIGRHSRDDRRKWPATREEIVEVYPTDGSMEVRVLGGADHALRELGGLPDNWTTYAFGAMPPERFLAGIDFFVYFHHPSLVEAFGRTILEAMASGAVAVLPHHFERLFGDAPVYSTAAGARDAVRALYADHAAYLERSRRGQDFVRERFGHEAHVRRLARLIGDPAHAPDDPRAPAEGMLALGGRSVEQSTHTDDRPRVLFLSSNGAGVGHLMRLMSMARRSSDEVVPLFLSLSQAVPVVRENGFFVEYLASRGATGMSTRDWHKLLRDRLDELIRIHDVRAVVFDGTWPFHGMFHAASLHPDVALVWSRRGMWKPGIDNPTLPRAAEFDLVIEPGEFAEAFDAGPTVPRRGEATRVAPITFLDPGELVDRDEARAHLGLDPDRPAALVQLGAGNINDVSSLLGAVTERLVAEEGLQVCVTRSIIAERAEGLETEVIPITGVYPLARYFRAFDFAVTAAGYNSYHESVAAGLPTIFVPNLETAADEQAARSSYAAEVGVGLHVPDPTPGAIDAAVRTMLDPDRRREMADEAARRYPGNGAADAMRAVEATLGIGDGPAPDRATGDLGSRPPRPADVEAPELAAAPRRTTVAGGRQLTPAGRAAERRAELRRRYRRGRAALARKAQSPEVRAVVRAPFNALPTPVRATVRRRLRRWESASPLVESVGAPHLPVPPGSLLPAAETEHGLPGVLFVLPSDLDERVHARLVERIAGLQVVHRGFAPLVATFSDDLAPYRRSGLTPEVIPSREVWSRARPPELWPLFVRSRLSRLTDVWDVQQVVPLGAVEGLTTEHLTAMSVRSLIR